MKRTLIFAGIVILSLLCLFGCGKEKKSDSSDTTMNSKDTKVTTEKVTTAYQPAINAGFNKATIPVTVNPDTRYQKILYMGASGCWVGKVQEYLSPMQLRTCMDLLYDKEKGIGMNSYRFNVGAGLPMSERGEELKTVPSLEKQDGSREYDLKRDAGSIAVLDMAIARGADHITLFVNSPPAYMTKSSFTSGNKTGTSNLKPEYYSAFAVYCADIVEVFQKKGYTIEYISPINEPSGDWGKSGNWQEGCHYEPDEVVKVDLLVAKELLKRGITDVKVSFPEGSQWNAVGYADALAKALAENPELKGYIDHFGCHSYNVDASGKATFYRLWRSLGLTDVPLHQTEFCSNVTGIDGALELARVIYEDFTILNCESWEFWVSMMTDEYSFIEVHNGSYEVSKRMWAMGNYSKFIIGSERIQASYGVTDVKVSAYRNDEKSQTYLVFVNTGRAPSNILLPAQYKGCHVEVFETSQRHDLDDLGRMDPSLGYSLSPHSVTTFVVTDAGK